MKTAYRFLAGTLLAIPAWALSPASLIAQDCSCGPAYRVVNKVIYDQEPLTCYRVEYDTVLEDRQVTTSRPVFETEMRVRRFRVAKPVIETATREEKFFVLKPVYETEYREEVVNKTTWVQETEMRQQKIIVNRPVVETQMQQRQHTVRRAVNETVMQQQCVTAMEPVTTYRTQLVDQGAFVDSTSFVPGRTTNRIAWVPRGVATDNATGQVFRHHAGFHCVPTTTPGALVTQRIYVPNVVAQQIPQTTMMPRQVMQEVPVNVTRYQDEVVTEQVPVQVQRIEQVEEVREYPVTVNKPMTEQITNRIPIQKVRYEKEEHVRHIPIQTQRIEYEEREEEYPVQVCRMETEVKTVQVPVTVRKVVPYTTYRVTPRIVSMRVAVDAFGNVIPEAAPAVRRATERIVLPPHQSSIIRPGVESQRPVEELRSTPEGEMKAIEKPVPTPDDEKPAGDESSGPKDTDPTGKPKIDAEKPAADPKLNAPNGAKPAKPAENKDKSSDKTT